MRGKDLFATVITIDKGITPAYAGKSALLFGEHRAARDHPRVCGEKDQNPIGGQFQQGSPPRMRGKVPAQKKHTNKEGDHPRVCGEKFAPADFLAPFPRITPAYAGKSMVRNAGQFPQPDHPRVCGEKGRQAVPTSHLRGSPPRMRGKVDKTFDEAIAGRITPAYAGKSRIDKLEWIPVKDHPRVCGEKLYSCIMVPTSVGITPAYAGKRNLVFGHFGAGVDHPRVCGEKVL